MTSTLGRGLLAGAVGTTLLNLASYADMALTGRSASTAPAETVQRALGRLGVGSPARGPAGDAVGALAGIAAGLGVGVLAAGARRMGVRLPAPAGAAVVGALAMAATDAPMASLGVSDPRSWSAADWTRDIVPHLAYGVGVRWVLDATERPEVVVVAEGTDAVRGSVSASMGASGSAPVGRTLTKSLLAGLAAGGRSSFGLAAPLLTSNATRARVLGMTAVLGEMVVDKLPATPSRLDSGLLAGRVAAGAVGGTTEAARNGHAGLSVVAAALGIAGSVAGSVLGAAWREVAADKGFAWPAAFAEDAASLAVAAYALG